MFISSRFCSNTHPTATLLVACGVLVLATMLASPAIARGTAALTPEQAEVWATADSNLPAGRASSGRVNALVWLEPGADRRPVRSFAERWGGSVRYEYKNVLPDVINLRSIPLIAIDRLGRTPGVVRIEPDRYHERVVNLDESTPRVQGLQSQLAGGGMVADGSDVRVCVIDTGVDSDHQMYSSRIDTAAGWDFHNNDSDPEDDNGHGAHVAGIAVGGMGVNVDLGCEGPEPFQGVGPAATLIGIKVLDQNGGGSESNIIAGMDHCADQSAEGARGDVMSLSIGTGEFSTPCDHAWAVAANNAVANGVVVVAAAGNDGFENALASPACGADVISVGATYKDNYPNCENPQEVFTWCLDFFCNVGCADGFPLADTMVCSSNNSAMLDVTAPGSMILSASKALGGTSTIGMSGTSQAAAHVAGLAALILDADPTLTPAQVRQIIREGAVDLGPVGFDSAYGYGRIDVMGSLALVDQTCGDATCGTNEDACNCPQDCGAAPASETDCTNVIDDDCDNSIDCDDNDCDTDPICFVCGDGSCDPGEDCTVCPEDCFSVGDAQCGNGECEAADGEDCLNCPADCAGNQGGKRGARFCCGGGGGENPVSCADSRCTDRDWQCADNPSVASCCGDGICEGTEDLSNCVVDCPPCEDATDCSDSDGCTEDICNEDGTCSNPPIDCDDGDACTADGCSNHSCYNDPIDCDDGDDCTTDSCDPEVGCVNTFLSCFTGDDCCGPECEPSNDLDCVVCGDGTCDITEDCWKCSEDCFSTTDAACGNGRCEAGDGEDCLSCPEDCNGTQNGKPDYRYCCGDGDGENPVSCSDARCSYGAECMDAPAIASCCGDGVCEGIEDVFNCILDCPPCEGNDDCDDGDACTWDVCNPDGSCSNPPLDCSDGDACTADTCSDGICSSAPISCDDGNSCTADSCDPAVGCENTYPACSGSVADGCCGPACDASNDTDCTVCGNGVCEGNGEDCFTCLEDCACKGKQCERYCCGDGVCFNETERICAIDCGG